MIYGFYRLVAFLVRLLPLKGAYWLGLRICDLMFFLNRRGRAAVRENLRIVFEGQGIRPSRHVLDGCARKTFQYFGKYLADFIRFRKLTAEGVLENVSIQGLEHLEAIRDSKRGAIMLTAHYGNWELGGAFIASMGIPVNAVVRPVPSPALERVFSFFREQRGLKVIPLAHAGTGILKALKHGEAVALVGDRDFTGNGRPHAFFGRDVSLPRGAAWFAHRTGVPIYMGFATRAPDDSFILRMHPPIDPAAVQTEDEIQEKIVAIMEATIARDPCQWFIFDPFWPREPEAAPESFT
ncbi:MAG: lysophospholipid acyltransferase family protein [Kiritimatiellia bacterium]